jgi:hypothetical protein
MRSLGLGRYALTSCVAAAMLAGCGGSQPPIGAPAMQQSRAIATHADHSASWIAPDAKSKALVYAVDGCGGTCVFAYPSGQYVGAIRAHGSAACSNEEGDVFFPNGTTITEYAHGGTNPIATLNLPGALWTGGCSVDPITGDLAVAFGSEYYSLAIFPKSQGSAALYPAGDSMYVAYDNNGNLFVNRFVGQYPGLTELPAGGSSINQISVPPSVLDPGQLQWDGSYLAWQAGEAKGPRRLTRLSISGSQATVVSQRLFHGFNGTASQLWIYKDTVVLAYARGGIEPRKIGVWEYPKLRKLRVFNFHDESDDFQGVTVSTPPSALH